MSVELKYKILGDFDNDVASRQKLLRGWRQKKLAESHVLVAGVGALGNEIVKDLTLLGVGEITIVDFDRVVASNLNRCVLFRRRDIDSYKVDAVARNVRELDPYGYVKVNALRKRIEDLGKADFKGVDVLVSGLDNIMARLYLNAYAVELEIPLVDGGMDGYLGYVQTVIPYKTPCLYCGVTEHTRAVIEEREQCSGDIPGIEEKIAAIVTTTAFISAVMSQDVVKIILGVYHYLANGKWPRDTGAPLAGKRLFVNLRDNVYRVFELSKNPKCEVCGEDEYE